MRENARKDHFNQAEPIEKTIKPEDNLRNIISKSKSIDEKKRGSRSSSAAGYKSDVDYGNKNRKMTSTVEKQPQDSELGGGTYH